jgi:hypothetical protein
LAHAAACSRMQPHAEYRKRANPMAPTRLIESSPGSLFCHACSVLAVESPYRGVIQIGP